MTTSAHISFKQVVLYLAVGLAIFCGAIELLVTLGGESDQQWWPMVMFLAGMVTLSLLWIVGWWLEKVQPYDPNNPQFPPFTQSHGYVPTEADVNRSPWFPED